ncbi:hypothetical protein MPSEU_000786300 [Mayamaea pseudoterrestris]|nr:hypothetical protein MPSEU_000786300 [Mayamaea pseudoterrestris]
MTRKHHVAMSSLPRSIPPSLTWIFVFGPALAYLIATRTSGLSVTGDLVAHQILLSATSSTSDLSTICSQVSSIVSLVNHRCIFSSDTTENDLLQELAHPLAIVQTHGFTNVTSMTWKHDSDLNRGYLLLADAAPASQGRVWRWETGGGPIAIGKTLHLNQAGCRSNVYRNCSDASTMHELGPGGMAIDFYGKEDFAEGRLVVSEWGEGRIVRLEENGARTPLVATVPNVCVKSNSSATTRRVEKPTMLQYTPSGDLFFIDHYKECQQSALFVIKHAVHAPSIGSLAESRAAHYEWTHLGPLPELVLTRDALGGLALSHDHKSLLVTAVQNGRTALLLQVSLENDDALDDVDEEHSSSSLETQPRVLLQLDNEFDEPGFIVVDQKGHIFWALHDTILLIDSDLTILARLSTIARIHSMTLGGDNFLYVATRTSLLRMPVKNGPSKVPTDLVRKQPTPSTKNTIK